MTNAISNSYSDKESIFESGNCGETGAELVSNRDFLDAVFGPIASSNSPAVCSKIGDPSAGGWNALLADKFIDELPPNANNYVSCSSFYPSDIGGVSVRKKQFAACHFLMLDDLGTKVPLERFKNFEFSWLIETSPGNHQAGLIFREPIREPQVAEKILQLLIEANLSDPGATGPTSRWARLPVAVNGKEKYLDSSGSEFRCRLVQWRPSRRYTPEEIVAALNLKSTDSNIGRSQSLEGMANDGEVWTPKSAQNPVVLALKQRGLYKTPLGSGKHDVTCPWVHEHTDSLDTGAAYFEPEDQFPLGGFCCQHSHREKYKISALLNFLNVDNGDARHKPVIRVIQGELYRIVDSAEKALAERGRYYQSGGLIVSVVTDPATRNSTIQPITQPRLTLELSSAASWVKYVERKSEWVRIDPSAKAVSVLFDAQSFAHLQPLLGVSRSPYFREVDGELVTDAGYDAKSKRYGVFNSREYDFPEPTLEAAKSALKEIEALFTEFHFVTNVDKAAAVAAVFTAVTRSTYPLAPGFHVRAPVYGSGKSYLCDLIGSFASATGVAKVSYPTTSEEATKVLLSLLLESPAVIEFDDMDTDWIPHGIVKRVFTADQVTDRILGVSKTATVSTRSLFLGSGNNVGPIRDLLRRVITINIDPRCATPATMKYQDLPVEKVRANRAYFVSCVLTIIRAWKDAGCPKSAVNNIVSFDGMWSDYCRYPLIWLGYPDPADLLVDQLHSDSDSDALHFFMSEWSRIFGDRFVTLRRVIETANKTNVELLDAIHELPVVEHGAINQRKLGWMMKTNLNRIVNGLEIRQGKADGRNAWKVIEAKTPVSPVLPV
jgi:hypothetical protein